MRIKNAQTQARENYSAFFQSEAGKNNEEWPPVIDEFRKTLSINCDQALALAQKHRDRALSVDILKFVVDTARGGPSDHSARAFAELQQYHSTDTKLSEFLMQKYWISDFQETESLLRHIARSHPDANQKGYAKYGLARLIMRRCEQKRNYLNEKCLTIKDETAPCELAMSVDLDKADLEIREILKDLVTNHAEAPLGEIDLLGEVGRIRHRR
ncbi:MAG: hypothetical protein ACK58L_17670 [Planctomycetota bacterium]